MCLSIKPVELRSSGQISLRGLWWLAQAVFALDLSLGQSADTR
jgi:hypothetical protein